MAGGNRQTHTYQLDVVQGTTPGQKPPVKNQYQLAYATGSQTFYMLNKQDQAAFLAATQWFQPTIGQVLAANALPNDQDPSTAVKDPNSRYNQIKGAKAALNSILKSKVQGADKNTLAEVVYFGNKQFLYLDQTQLAQLKNSYSVEDEANQQAVQNDDGSFSVQKLLSKFQIDIDLADYEKDYSGQMTDLAKALGVPSLDVSKVFFGNPKDPNSILVATADAQLMRYTAGLSASASFDPAERSFSVDATAQSQLTLGSAHVNVTCYAPNQDGWHVRILLPTKNGNSAFDVGYFYAKFTLDLSAFAGASVMGSVNMTCNMSQDGKLQVNGSNGATASANAFAGAQAGCDVGCTFSWQNPEKGQGADGWDDLANIDAAGDISAGMGVNGDFCIDYNKQTGRFLVHAAAGLTCGPGLDGSITMAVDGKHVASFVAFVYHKIMNSNYQYTGAITDFAFKLFIDLSTKAIFYSGIEIASLYINEAKTIASWWFSVAPSFVGDPQVEQVLSVASNINNNTDRLKFTVPEVKGRLLYILTDPGLPQAVLNNAAVTAQAQANMGVNPSYVSQNTIQEIAAQDMFQIESAILTILSYVQSKHDYENVVTHMSLNPMEKIPDDEGEQRLYNSLVQSNFSLSRLQQLNFKLNNGEVVYSRYPLYNQPVQPNKTVIGIRDS